MCNVLIFTSLTILLLILTIVCSMHTQKESFSWAPVTPSVKGVTIVDNNIVALQSALDSGMMTVDAIKQMMPNYMDENREVDYKDDVSNIRNSLELDSTLTDLRAQVAAANAQWIPEEGNTIPGLWTQRNPVSNLFQDGLNGSNGKP